MSWGMSWEMRMSKVCEYCFQIRGTLSLELSRFMISSRNHGESSFLDRVSKLSFSVWHRVLEPLPRQLLGTLEPSMVALRLLPAGEGASNRLGSDSLVGRVNLKQLFKETTFEALVELEVGV